MKKELVKKLGIGCIVLGSVVPTSVKAQDNLTIDVSSSLVSHYVAMGYVLGKGPHKQDYIGINKNNFTLFFWDDYDFGKKKTGEIDLGISYNQKINDKFSTKLEYLYMHYPAGDDDNVMRFGISHKGKFSKGIKVANFFRDKEIPNGLVFMGNISKDIYNKNNTNISLGIRGTYSKNFYKDNGLTSITPEVIFSRSGRKIDLSAFLKQQFGFIKEPKMLPPAKTQFYGGINLSKKF